MGIVALLYPLTQGSFDGLLGIVGDGLKLVDGHQAGLLRLAEVSKDFIERHVGPRDVSKALPNLAPFGTQFSENIFSELIDKFIEVLGLEDVDVDAMKSIA